MPSDQIEVRPCGSEADERLSLEIHNVVWPRRAITMDEVRSFQSAMHDHADFLVEIDGRAAGSAAVAILPQRPTAGFALVTVLADTRRLGAGTALYVAVSEWTRARGLEILHVPLEEDDPESLAYAQRRGFVEKERYSRMLLDLTSTEEPEADSPAGVEIVTWAERPELARGIYEVAMEAYEDVPGAENEEMEPFEDWLAHDMQGSGDRLDATFVALAGDQVVGYAKFSLTNARPKVAFHDMTGVRRTWRGRGIAGALKRTQIAWAMRAGFEELETSNEERNEPIRRLNAQLGYRLAPGRMLLEGPLAAP
jgi:GNAT superfamily N-acetyltransferase